MEGKGKRRGAPGALLTLAGAGLLGAVSLAGLLLACASKPGAVGRPILEFTPPPPAEDLYAEPSPSPVAPTAAPTRPPVTARATRLVIESIGLDAPIVRMAYENGQWSYYGPDEVAWIATTGSPGSGRNSLLYGHLDWINRGAAFWRLKEVKLGDKVRVALEDGSELTYVVTASHYLEGRDPMMQELERPVAGDLLTLETCGGAWNPDKSKPYGGEYTHRRVVRAERLLGSSSAPGQGR